MCGELGVRVDPNWRWPSLHSENFGVSREAVAQRQKKHWLLSLGSLSYLTRACLANIA